MLSWSGDIELDVIGKEKCADLRNARARPRCSAAHPPKAAV